MTERSRSAGRAWCPLGQLCARVRRAGRRDLAAAVDWTERATELAESIADWSVLGGYELEGNGAWVHGDSYTTYARAREERQRRLGDAVKRWHEEERRLFRLARVVLDLRSMEISGLVAPFWEQIHFGERSGVIGPNGSRKSALIDVLAAARVADSGQLRTGPRVSAGLFTQLQSRADFTGRVVLEIVLAQRGEMQAAVGALARYGLADAARRRYDVLSGGEKARLGFLMVLHNGGVLSFPSYDSALEALLDPARAPDVRLAKLL